MRDGSRLCDGQVGQQSFVAAANFPFDVVPQGTTVPGGFSQLFNRVLDLGIYARLGPAAQTLYLPLVRFADCRNEYRAAVSVSMLCKRTGCSRTTCNRGLKELLRVGLIRIVEQGGTAQDGLGETNVYQLLNPCAGRGVGTASGPHPVPSTAPTLPHQWTPPPSASETHPVPKRGEGVGTASGTLLKNNSIKKQIQQQQKGGGGGPMPDAPLPANPVAAVAVVVLLLEAKVEGEDLCRELATKFDQQRIEDVIAWQDWKISKGKCENPGGFVVSALRCKWQVPDAVKKTQQRALLAKQQEREARAASAQSAAQKDQGDLSEAARKARIESLEPVVFEKLKSAVLAKYENNLVVSKVLNKRPVLENRLFMMEIEAMMGSVRT